MCAVPLSTLLYVLRAYSPFHYADQWLATEWIQPFYEGTARWSDLWSLHNEHCIAFGRLFYLVDYFLFNGTDRFLVPSILLVHTVAVAVLLRAVWTADALPAGLKRFLGGAHLGLLYAAVQIENFAWGFQIVFILVFAAAILSAASYLAYKTTPPGAQGRGWYFALSAGMGVVATFSMANGILIWPILLGLAIVHRFRRNDLYALAPFAGGTLLLRALLGLPAGKLHLLAQAPARFAYAFALYLGTPFAWRSVPATKALGAAGVVALALTLLHFGRRAFRLPPFQLLHLAVVLFVAGSGLATSLGRIDRPDSWIVSDRYATAALLFWNSLIALWVAETARWAGRSGGLARGAVLASAALFLGLGILPAHVRAGRAAPLLSREYERASLALITGVYDEEQLGFIWIFPKDLPPLVPFARRHRLGMFALDWPHLMGRNLASAYALRPPVPPTAAAGCVGRFERVLPVPHAADTPPPRGRRVAGWAWDLEAQAPPPVIVLADAEGVVRGFGLPYVHRPDIAAAHGATLRGNPTDAGWFGYITDAAPPVRAYAVSNDGRTAYQLAGAFTDGTP